MIKITTTEQVTALKEKDTLTLVNPNEAAQEKLNIENVTTLTYYIFQILPDPGTLEDEPRDNPKFRTYFLKLINHTPEIINLIPFTENELLDGSWNIGG